jgi:cell division transport system ATP-binding protein
MIEFRNVYKVYDSKVYALTNINLKINKAEFVFITGKSGAGKSTLLKLIFGAQKLSKGELLVGNINISNISSKKLAFLRRQMGLVFQDFKLLWDRTVYENVAMPLSIAANKNYKDKVYNILDQFDILQYKNIYPYQLSGGEQQKVSIARAVINDPWIIIADEPTGNLDTQATDEVFYLFEKISKLGTTIVFATHNERLINKHKGRILELRRGSLVI